MEADVVANSVPLLSVGTKPRADKVDQELASLEAARSRLIDAVSDFRKWAAGCATDQRSAEWEADYGDWPAITTAFCEFLDLSCPADWGEQVMDLLLYILARDNEDEVLKDELALRPAHLIALAKAALLSAEPDARWQIADALGSVDADDADVEPLIERFLLDADEYVSRRALIALTRRGAAQLDVWAVRAWDTGHEYQRMAALEAFAAGGSPLLPAYLDQARADRRQYLVRLADEIRTRQKPR